MATLVLDVGDDGDDEPDQLERPAPGLTLLLAGDTVLEGGGGHVLRPQCGEATSCRGDQHQQWQQHFCIGDDWWEVATILRAGRVM